MREIEENLAWECICGNLEYARLPPEECPQCFRIGSFTQLPEELIEERERNFGDNFIIKRTTSVKKTAKIKTKKYSSNKNRRKTK